MALIHIEGFDSLAVADLSPAGYVTNVTTNLSLVAGRYGSYALQNSSSSSTRTVRQPFSEQAVTTGIAWKASTYAGGSNAGNAIIGIASDEGIDTPICAVSYDADNARMRLYAVSSAGSTSFIAEGIPGSVNIPLGTYAYVELSYDPSDTSAIVRVNGSVALSIGSGANPHGFVMTGIDVGPWGTGSGTAATGYGTFDDWYINGGANAFLGDGRVVTRFPTSDTSRNDFTPSAGTDNFAMVDELNPDADVTYNEANVAGDQDRYASNTSIGSPLTIHGVMVRSFMKKTDAGDRTARNVLKSSATLVTGDTVGLGAGYAAFSTMVNTNPATGAAWTAATVTASEFGAEIVA